MSLLVGAFSVLCWVAAGCAPLLLFGDALSGRRWYGRAALACALGAAVTGLVQVLLSACGVAAGAVVPCALAVVSLAWCLARRERGVRATESRADAALPAWLGALLVLVALVGLGAGVGTPFRSDGSKFWAPKARELSRVGASDAPSLHDPERLGVHRDYPLLVPALLAPVFAFSPPDATSGPKLALGALLVALLGVLATLLARCGATGLVVLAAFATQPLLVSLDVRESAVAAGYVDGVQALFLLLLVVAVETVRESPTRLAGRAAGDARAGDVRCSTGEARDGGGLHAGLLAALAGAALASTKLEGAVEAAVIFGAALAVGPHRRALFAAACGALLLALPTFVIAAGVAPGEPGFSLSRLADPALWQARLLPVIAGLAGLLVDVSSFGLLPLLLVVLALQRAPRGSTIAGPDDERAAASAARDAARRRRWFVALMSGGALAFVMASYLSTNMQAERHMDTSAHRLLWQWLPAAAWLVARRHAPAASPAEHRARTGVAEA